MCGMDNRRIAYGAAGAALGFYLLSGFIPSANPLLLAIGGGLVAYNYGPENIGL